MSPLGMSPFGRDVPGEWRGAEGRPEPTRGDDVRTFYFLISVRRASHFPPGEGFHRGGGEEGGRRDRRERNRRGGDGYDPPGQHGGRSLFRGGRSRGGAVSGRSPTPLHRGPHRTAEPRTVRL